MDIWETLVDRTVLWSMNLAVGLLVFVGFWIAGVISHKVIKRIGRENQRGEYITDLLARAAKTAFLIFGAITALGTLGINVSALVAALGLTGFALGFALKDVLSNLLAGILILTYRPFAPNDTILVAGKEGKVVDIDLRYTTLEAEGKTILIPNSTLFTNIITVLGKG